MSTFSDRNAEQFRFDPFSPDYEKNPHPILHYMRENCPAYWWPDGPAWVFTRYDDVTTLLKDQRFTPTPAFWEHMPKKDNQQKTEHERIMDKLLFSYSSKDHSRIRGLATPAFTPQAIENYLPVIEEVIKKSLPIPNSKGIFDVKNDYARHIPMDVICNMLHVPEDMIPHFRIFGPILFHGTNVRLKEAEKAKIEEPIASGVEMLNELIEERRKHLQDDDLLSALIREEQAGAVNPNELLGLVASMIGAGSDTTILHIYYSVFNLLKVPEQLQILLNEPSLFGNGTREILRYDFFARLGNTRYALEDVEIRGVTIKKGQLVYPNLAAAMRDPAVFPDPDRLDVRRDQNKNIAFGGGRNHCLGTHLARLEVEVAIRELFKKYPNMQLISEPIFEKEFVMRRFTGLPVQVLS